VSQKIDVLKDQLVTEQERLRSEFETFRNKDFKDLEARVAALEKKYQRLQEIINNLNIP
jgi:polyhydroxyalkanoate synthesis regulator phasin